MEGKVIYGSCLVMHLGFVDTTFAMLGALAWQVIDTIKIIFLCVWGSHGVTFRPWVPLCVVVFLFVLFLATTVHLHYPHVNVLSAIMTYHEFYISIGDFTSVNLSPSENNDLRATNFIDQSSISSQLY